MIASEEKHTPQISSELGELISAIGESWFGHTLPAVLQRVYTYDYFLLARYTPGHPLQIVRSDFRDMQMQQTLQYLVAETYVAEPIYRLFDAGRIRGGVFNMADLARQSQSLPEPINYDLPHLIKDNSEEIGWRTEGWPEYQQETCILSPLTTGELIAVSLFNFGLKTSELSSREMLNEVFPIVSSAISRHFVLLDSQIEINPTPSAMPDINVISDTAVRSFFESIFEVTITPREVEIFTSLLQGDTLAAIADSLGISLYTARTHRRNVYRKIGHGHLLELINQFHKFNSSLPQ